MSVQPHLSRGPGREEFIKARWGAMLSREMLERLAHRRSMRIAVAQAMAHRETMTVAR